MNEDLPDVLTISMDSVSNREWLWLEDSCGVVVTTIEKHPARAALAMKTLALRRWESSQGRPPSIGFGDVVDGKYDAVKLDLKAESEEDEESDPTGPVDAEA